MGYQFNPITGNLDLVGSSGGGGNPFDQSLNTTDDVAFNSLLFGGGLANLDASGVISCEGAFISNGLSLVASGQNDVGIGNSSNNGGIVVSAPNFSVSEDGDISASGNITAANLPATFFSGDAADLTGTLNDARLSASVALLTSSQTLTNKTLTAPVISNGSTSTILTADASNVLSVANSTSASGIRVFNTRTDASNWERGIFDWTTNANTLTIGTERAGTGTARRLRLTTAESLDIFTGATRPVNITSSQINLFFSTNFFWYSASSNPTTSTSPFSNGSGTCAVFKNTANNEVRLWVRDGTTMKSVLLA